MRLLAPGVWASPQPSPDDMAAVAAAGVRRVINNRPDHEEPGQPTSVEMEAAARAAGMDYLWIPVRGMPGPDQAAAVGEALADGTPTLLFCRSGTRSTVAWALARRARGDDPDALRAAAAGAGYDLSRLPL
ncbi:TIGR01244 family sulfur transferase [Brevundimonas viscosa]|uniref:TIGR01244 family protein n=1 Tax=Brevundimonas viscosa TaxID=871741 RepID=A0A1I6SYH3_9CAUL|nr:TIGR01244 family sulfur transferase [Brevundimonas viscosa]SFS81989.1 TIGR01244 family protein [Brevundimonas viscosa]